MIGDPSVGDEEQFEAGESCRDATDDGALLELIGDREFDLTVADIFTHPDAIMRWRRLMMV